MNERFTYQAAVAARRVVPATQPAPWMQTPGLVICFAPLALDLQREYRNPPSHGQILPHLVFSLGLKGQLLTTFPRRDLALTPTDKTPTFSTYPCHDNKRNRPEPDQDIEHSLDREKGVGFDKRTQYSRAWKCNV